MSGLEQAFYSIAIIFMAILLLLIIKILRAVSTIRDELSIIQKTLDKKLPSASSAPNVVSEIASVVRDFAKAIK
jgi:hypothetical protein